MTSSLTVAIDYLPALHHGFGIGRYVANLVPALLEADPGLRLKLYGVFLRNRRERIAAHDFPDPSRATFHSLPLPARFVPALARFLPLSARTFMGPFDLFHDTDYFVAPVRARPRVATLYDTAYLKDLGFVDEGQSEKMYATVQRLIAGATRIITISEFARSELVREFRLDPERISVTYLGVDPLFRREPAEEEIEETLLSFGLERPYGVFIGTLEPRKNLLRIIRAFARLLEIAPEYQLVLIGRRGHNHRLILDLIEDLEIQDAVHWLGRLPDRQTFLLLKGAQMLVYPSLYEGFGLPALEGMAAGIPVLSSASHALREVCGNGALLVNPRDEGEIFEGMRLLALDRGEALEIADRGRARAAGFTWERCARQTLDAYRATLEES